MLPDGPDVWQAYIGEDGALYGAKPGALLIDMSTIAPQVSRDLADRAAARGIGVLDAPVSGGDVGARNGTLTIMVGGIAADFDRARPLFAAMGTTVVHVGSHGAGQVVKACNQVVVALTIEAVSEAMVLGSKAGVDPAVILKVLSSGLAGNRVMEVRGRNFLEHDFAPGFRVELHAKDLRIALSAGHQEGVPLPVTALVLQMLEVLRVRGMGSADHSALLTVLEDLAQHKIGGPA
jgi:2-hydroxy-3-oxopropionate reductase